ncbi:hypothetical protein, partial [Janthinobacterium sp. UMAB-60]|uniref:hypothetical protein n=1 Tax=Janthinobacterium sp. UMAB-60 TaxID=1365365 RepID=UPI001C56D320
VGEESSDKFKHECACFGEDCNFGAILRDIAPRRNLNPAILCNDGVYLCSSVTQGILPLCQWHGVKCCLK